MEARNVQTESQFRRALASFLETYADRELLETEIDLAGWADETVNRLTELYEEGVVTIAKIPDVTVIAP